MESTESKGPRVEEASVEGRYYLTPRFIGTFAAISLMNISLYLGYVLPTNVISLINKDIGPDPNYILVPIVKTLGGGVGVLLVGRLGDIFGRRWFLIGGQTLGTIGAIIAATANDIETLMGATAFIGVASAVQLSFSFVIQEIVPNKHRGIAMAFQFAASFPFAAFGPLMARGLVLHTALGWRWCYYLNLISCGSSVILFFFFYKPPSSGLLQSKSIRHGLARIDYIGLLLYCGGLIMLLLGICWGGTVHPWTSPRVLGCLVAGVVTLGLFGVYEVYVPLEHPLVPFRIIQSRGFVALAVTGSVATIVYTSMTVLWPNLVTDLFTTDLITVGWYSCALGGTVALGQISAGFTVRLFGRARRAHWQMRIAAAATAAFFASMATVAPGDKARAIALIACAGFAVGYVELLALLIVPFTCAPEHIGLASGFQASCRGVAGSIATAIFSTILSNRNEKNIPRYVIPAAVKAGLTNTTAAEEAVVTAVESGTAAAYAAIPGVTDSMIEAIKAALKRAYASSFRLMFLISLAFGLAAVLASMAVPNVDEHLLTEQVANKLERTEKGDFDVELEKGDHS